MNDARLLELNEAADKMLLLNRYVGEIERSLDRMLQRLEQR